MSRYLKKYAQNSQSIAIFQRLVKTTIFGVPVDVMNLRIEKEYC